MTYQTLLYSVTDDVATITLNRPERMNALSVELMIELADAIGRIQKEGARAGTDRSEHVVLLRRGPDGRDA